MTGKFKMDDYVDVAERIAEFRAKHPEGSLQPADPAVPYRIETIGDQTFIVVVAAAYRHPDDQRPGVGMAYEPFPGATSFTKNSELQNAETSAWGRAIVAVGAADTKRGIASRQEIENRNEPAAPTPTARLWDVMKRKGVTTDEATAAMRTRWNVDKSADLTDAQIAELIAEYGQLQDVTA